jgi:hypothetical protein
MAVRLGHKQLDAIVLGAVSGRTGAGADAFLIAVKAYLDQNFAQFQVDGKYTVPHIKSAITTLLTRGV